MHGFRNLCSGLLTLRAVNPVVPISLVRASNHFIYIPKCPETFIRPGAPFHEGEVSTATGIPLSWEEGLVVRTRLQRNMQTSKNDFIYQVYVKKQVAVLAFLSLSSFKALY